MNLDEINAITRNYNLRVRYSDRVAVLECLPEDYLNKTQWMTDVQYNTRPAYHDQVGSLNGSYNETSFQTAERPFILYDNTASFCSILFSMQRNGSAVESHDAFCTFGRDSVKKRFQMFRELSDRIAGREKLTIMTGTNLQQPFDNPGDYFNFLQDEFPEALYLIAESGHGFGTLAVSYVSGLIFIPQQLSRTGMNEYFIIAGEKLNDVFPREIERKSVKR